MLWLIKQPLFNTPDSNDSGGDVSRDDVIEFLSEDDNKEELIDLKPEKKPKVEATEDDETEVEVEEEEEIDELSELEEELKEPTDEDLEITLHVSKREIKAKYPTFFKDFPSVEKAIYREQAYTEVFPTVAEAKDASEKASTLDRFENDLIGGNTEKILAAVKSEDENAFNKIVDNYLPTLAKVDQNAYYHVIGRVVQTTVKQMIAEASRSDDDTKSTLNAAARILHQFAFGTTEFKELGPLSSGETKKDDTVDKERESYTRQRFEETRDELGKKVSNTIRGTIEHNIDPNSSMTDFVKRTAVREALEKVNELIGKDARFKSILDKAWEYAAKNGFNEESKQKIRNAYLSKAKTLLPAIIKSTRNEALKGIGKRVKESPETEQEESTPKDKKDKSTSSVKLSGKNDRDKAKQIPRGVRTIDFLNSD